MKRYLPLFLDTLAMAALAIWLGELAATWMAVAPAVSSAPADALTSAQPLFFAVLRKVSAHIEVCGLTLAAAQWVMRRRYQRDRTLFIADGVRMLVLFLALFCAEYGRYVLIPTLQQSYATSVQSLLAGLAIVQAILLIGYAAVTGWMQLPRAPASVAAAPVIKNSVPARPAAGKRPKR